MSEQTAPQPKTLDIPSGKLTAGGEQYFIQYSLSTNRYVEYLKRVPRLTFHATFEGMYDTLAKIYTAASSGNDMIYAIAQARELSWNQLDAIRRFDENEIPDIIDFCCLFINKVGEDVSQFDHAIHEQKKAAISREGYDISGFFTLAFSVIENLKPAYHKIKSVHDQKDQNGIALTDHTQQTSPIS
jgi:hypothetical protein